MKLLDQELGFFMNIGMRMLTGKDVKHLRGAPLVDLTAEQQATALKTALPERKYVESALPERLEVVKEPVVSTEDLSALGAVADENGVATNAAVNPVVLNAAMNAAVNAALNSTSKSASKVQSEAVNAAVNAAVSAANSVSVPSAAVNAVNATNAVNAANSISLTLGSPAANATNSASLTLGSPAANATNSASLTLGSPAANLGNIAQNSMQLSVAQPTPTRGVTFSDGEAIGDDEYESLDNPNATALNTAANSRPVSNTATLGSNSGINVQTNSQPVLVVPMNVSQQQASPAASQYVQSPAPGAPPTLTFDTSEPVLRNLGLPSTATYGRAASKSPNRRVAAASGGSSSISASSAPNVKVNVVKEG
jgi:hypothetical protein